jgi:hypothetical protein
MTAALFGRSLITILTLSLSAFQADELRIYYLTMGSDIVNLKIKINNLWPTWGSKRIINNYGWGLSGHVSRLWIKFLFSFELTGN